MEMRGLYARTAEGGLNMTDRVKELLDILRDESNCSVLVCVG